MLGKLLVSANFPAPKVGVAPTEMAAVQGPVGVSLLPWKLCYFKVDALLYLHWSPFRFLFLWEERKLGILKVRKYLERSREKR